MASKDEDAKALDKGTNRRDKTTGKAAKGGEAADSDARSALGGLARLVGGSKPKPQPKGKPPKQGRS